MILLNIPFFFSNSNIKKKNYNYINIKNILNKDLTKIKIIT